MAELTIGVTAYYWRHQSAYSRTFCNEADAQRFLDGGVEWERHSAIGLAPRPGDTYEAEGHESCLEDDCSCPCHGGGRRLLFHGPRNCAAVFAALGRPHLHEEEGHARIRGLGPDGDQAAYWGDALRLDEASGVWSVMPCENVCIARTILDRLYAEVEHLRCAAYGNDPESASCTGSAGDG